eukprot:SM000046S16406  [mRNA]  locus=s46:454369:457263:- [translate_table: standard]
MERTVGAAMAASSSAALDISVAAQVEGLPGLSSRLFSTASCSYSSHYGVFVAQGSHVLPTFVARHASSGLGQRGRRGYAQPGRASSSLRDGDGRDQDVKTQRSEEGRRPKQLGAFSLGPGEHIIHDLQHLQHPDLAGSSEANLGMAMRAATSVAMYGGLATMGYAICSLSGVDFWGGFRFSPDDFFLGILCSLPPIIGSLTLQQDTVVESWLPAKAIRDAEDEEILDFFVGLRTWQFALVGISAAIAEELFFRSAVQGGLAHALQLSGRGVSATTYGIAALTGVVPVFSPCAQVMACVLTAAVTGSTFYILCTPKDPQYVVSAKNNNRWEMKRKLEAWHERQQLKKIYSPLLESLLSFYLGFEWLRCGNLLAPIVTHALYCMVTINIGMRRVELKQESLQEQAVSRLARHSKK